MKASSIVAIVSILIVISITVFIGAKLVRDIIRRDRVKTEERPDDTVEDDMVEEDTEELMLDNQSYDVSMEPMIQGGSYESFDPEMPPSILIVQTVHTQPSPQMPVQSKAKVEEIGSRMMNTVDSQDEEEEQLDIDVDINQIEDVYEGFDEQSSVPIDTTFNILSVDDSVFPRAEYVDIDVSDEEEAKIEHTSSLTLQAYDGDDDF